MLLVLKDHKVLLVRIQMLLVLKVLKVLQVQIQT
jgi:hypothetical protein